MRQRKIKDIENKLLDYRYLIVDEPAKHKDDWRGSFQSEETGDCSQKKLYVEIGCGKGRFINEMAENNPDDLFVAIEGFSSVIYRAVGKTGTRVRPEAKGNLQYILNFVVDLGTWFGEGELDGIFLNFSDPWPKKKNAKRRLTYRDRLEQYAKTLAPGGFIKIKTDNEDFFEFTLEEIDAYNGARRQMDGSMILEIQGLSRDLHASPYHADSPMTEYEAKFSGSGKNINYVELVRR